MLFIFLQVCVVFGRIKFSEIAKHKHHIPCNQLQDAKEYLDMIEHKDQLIEDSKILESYIGRTTKFENRDLTMQDLEGISQLLEYYDNTEDLERRDQLLQELYNQIVTMKSSIDYDLEQIDDSQYDRISDLVNHSECEDVTVIGSFQPLFKQEEKPKKEKVQERIRLSNNSKTIKLPRRRKHAKKYVITKKPYEWDRDIKNYDDIPIPNHNDYPYMDEADEIDCFFD
ncbi:unnamed protein product (macronuclear) [Paramecium tetraurelia]|uniref:Uncharacterized protein n=1 Tax=Paramecium tetraurelia TaxID=5888 RepID=A0DCU1_PARTE|nr:uncharacterized protein GSPATT00015717001 [Paramecium tetraurelia]CAK80858.1 unnamed protein product [Paramecium tetraurelia]|eukprot:XP_001448255.1 hypothetical protein (macronuclear) [Paramecium tetraurelia strain d4-2]